MAHINMEGEQIFALNGVRQIVRGGGKVTHILKVEVARHVSAETADRLQTAIYNHIANVAITIIAKGKPVFVTWTPAEAAYPNYYHCYSALFNDGGVLHHTQALLRQLIDRLDPDFDNGFSNGTLGFALLVSKPFGREVYIDSGGFILLGAKRKREEANT
jgi:hypothetical protein